MSEPTTRIMDLSDYWNMVRARRWTVIIAALLIAALSAGYVLLKPKVYYAQAKVAVSPLINVAITPVPGSTAGTLEPDMPTEAEVATSATIAALVRDNLSLSQSPETLVKSVTVTVVRDTTVMTIGFTSSDPQVAADVANAFANAYITNRQEVVH